MRIRFSHLLWVFLFVQIPTALSQEFTMPSFVHAIDACDMDMDGSNDIIVSCSYEDSIVILFNDEYGNFSLNYYNRITSNLICGCFDGDNIPDIITGKEGYLYFIKSYGDQTIDDNIELFPFSGSYILYDFLDFDSDGWNDILYKTNSNSHWGCLKNNGNLTLNDEVIYIGNSSRPYIGNLNSDNLPDIVVSYPDPISETEVYINNDNFNFDISTVLDLVISDPIIMESDNCYPEDLVLMETPTSNIYFYKNLGNANFEFKGNHSLINAFAAVLNDYNDYNNDGYYDICYSQCPITGCNDSIYLAFNSQNWSFTQGQAYYVGTLNWFRLISTDLNSDNFPDLVMTGYNSNNKVKILWNNGDGTFSYLNPLIINEKDTDKDIDFQVNPNPFFYRTQIAFRINEPALISLKIMDIYGEEKSFLVKNQKLMEGKYSYYWNGNDFSGKKNPPGIYIVILEINSNQYSVKIIHY